MLKKKKKNLIKFLSSLKLNFKDGLKYEFYYPFDSSDEIDVTITKIKSDGIVHVVEGYDDKEYYEEIDYEQLSLEDLIDLTEEVIKSSEFKEKYLK